MCALASNPISLELSQPSDCLTFSHVAAQLETGLTLFAGAPLASPLALPFCVPFLLRREMVTVVDGGNRFDLYRLTEWARRKKLSSTALLNQLRIARAFTPFQLAAILHNIDGEMQRYRSTRLVITGLPDCLYDEELSEHDARVTFSRCRENLGRLAARHTVLTFSDWPRHSIDRRTCFFDALASLARLVLEVNNTEPISFAPVKAPNLLTIPQKETKHGQNHTNC